MAEGPENGQVRGWRSITDGEGCGSDGDGAVGASGLRVGAGTLGSLGLYSTQGNANRMELLRLVFETRLGTGNMLGYVAMVRAAIRKLRDIDGAEAVSEPVSVMLLLNGLPAAYDAVKTRITSSHVFIGFEEAVDMLLRAEVQVACGHAHDQVPLSKSRVCWRCGVAGHLKVDCPRKPSRSRLVFKPAALTAIADVHERVGDGFLPCGRAGPTFLDGRYRGFLK